MKRIFLLVIMIVVVSVGTVLISFYNVNIFKDNREYYKYFEKEKLVGVDGEINLSGIRSQKEEVYNEVVRLFDGEEYNFDEYMKKIVDEENDNVSLQNDIDNLVSNVNDLEEKKASLNSEYEVLVKKYDKLRASLSSGVSTANSYSFPLINQYPNYPTGCESVSLTMLLRYYGVSVTPDMVIARLKKGSVPYYGSDVVLYGGNSELEFVGNPYSNASYGVYEKPIAEVANTFKSGINVKSNFAFSEVVSLVQNGTPVMVWTSMGLAVPYISSSWIYKPTMETISWKANEHAVVMIGATDSTVVVADPIGGKIKTYSRSTFESRYNYFGKKALYY